MKFNIEFQITINVVYSPLVCLDSINILSLPLNSFVFSQSKIIEIGITDNVTKHRNMMNQRLIPRDYCISSYLFFIISNIPMHQIVKFNHFNLSPRVPH